jgi:hypothetical protein
VEVVNCCFALIEALFCGVGSIPPDLREARPTVVFPMVATSGNTPTRGVIPFSALDDLEAHLAKLPCVSRAERGLTDHRPGGLASTSTRYPWAA